MKVANNVVFRRNVVVNNNAPNIAPAGAISASIPPGVGVWVLGVDDVVIERLGQEGLNVSTERLAPMVRLYKDRCATQLQLAEWVRLHFVRPEISDADRAQHLTDAVRPAVQALAQRLDGLQAWDATSISAAFKACLAEFGLKMPQLAIPVRVLACGRSQTPSVDAVLALFDKKVLVERLQAY